MQIKIKILLAMLLISSIDAEAQDKSNDTTAKYFLIQASISNQQEAAMGRIAAERATSADVKAFAKKMVSHHSNAQSDLMALANTKGINIPKEASDVPVDDPMLKDMPSKEFDRHYVHAMVPGHRQTVQLFEKYAITGKDADVKAFAEKMVPVLKDHLATIVAIDEKMNNAQAER